MPISIKSDEVEKLLDEQAQHGIADRQTENFILTGVPHFIVSTAPTAAGFKSSHSRLSVMFVIQIPIRTPEDLIASRTQFF